MIPMTVTHIISNNRNSKAFESRLPVRNSKGFLTIVLPFLETDGLCGADLGADGVPHIPAPIAFDCHFHRRRRVDNSKRAYHDTHPAGNASRLVNIDQSCLRISAHRSIGTGLDAGGVLTMPTLESKVLPLHVDSGNRMGFFLDGLIKFF
jgi:hypothetical protein